MFGVSVLLFTKNRKNVNNLMCVKNQLVFFLIFFCSCVVHSLLEFYVDCVYVMFVESICAMFICHVVD